MLDRPTVVLFHLQIEHDVGIMTNRLKQTGPIPETRIPLVHHRASILRSGVKSKSLKDVIIFLFFPTLMICSPGRSGSSDWQVQVFFCPYSSDLAAQTWNYLLPWALARISSNLGGPRFVILRLGGPGVVRIEFVQF